MAFNDGGRLLADIGSTYARFALETERGKFERFSTIKCADYADFGNALRGYLETVKVAGVRHAAIAIANPVEGDSERMTNYHWQFSIERTRVECGLDTLLVVNDYTPLARMVSHSQEWFLGSSLPSTWSATRDDVEAGFSNGRLSLQGLMMNRFQERPRREAR